MTENYEIAEGILDGIDHEPSDTRSDQLLEALVLATLAVSDALGGVHRAIDRATDAIDGVRVEVTR